MTEELQDPVETNSALVALDALPKELQKPYLVLSGWAVYLTAGGFM